MSSCNEGGAVSAGHIIFREGLPGDSMYIIKSEWSRCEKRDSATGIDFLIAAPRGRIRVRERCRCSQKNRVPRRSPHSKPSQFFMIGRADFRNLLVEDPAVTLGLARMLAERLEEAAKQVGIDYVNLSKLSLDRESWLFCHSH